MSLFYGNSQNIDSENMYDSNYSGIPLVPSAAALKKGEWARTPRAPARALASPGTPS